MDGEGFGAAWDVSRETVDRIALHLSLLRKWNPRINLVSKSTLDEAWSRHVADSAQLWRLRPDDSRVWVDLGAGGGFPGLVIAAIAAEKAPGVEVRLVESDERKAAFLATVVREAALPATVIAERAETLAPQAADIVSARALAPLVGLIPALERHRRPGGIGLFPKGGTVHKELEEARAAWRFDHRLVPSSTDPRAAIVVIGACDRV